MTLTERDRKLLPVFGVAVLAIIVRVVMLMWPSGADAPAVAAVDSIPAAERRLDRAKNLSSIVPGHRETLKKVEAELAVREQGLIVADTAAQAQAQLLDVIRRVARQSQLEVRGSELGQVKALGQDYGEATVAVTFECQIEQLVNVLADLTNQKELVSTQEIRIGQANGNEKKMVVRLLVAGVVPKHLVPERKGGAGGIL